MPVAEHKAITAKVARRLIPFLALLYFVSFLDRVNVGFAALTMNADLGLSASAFGFGAGIFFLGYVLFEVPSNLVLQKVGARIWIARIMISWGILSAATALAVGPKSFWLIRFLLGVAEAGFFPGMILYLTYWFPREMRGRVMGSFLIAIPLSSALGAPVSTALLDTSLFGLAGWQTMFLVEGIPAVLLGIVVLFVLPDGPQDATFLSAEEKRILAAQLDREKQGATHESLRSALLSVEVWTFGLIYLGLVTGLYGFSFWAPQMIGALGDLSRLQVGLISTGPFALGAAAMYFWGARIDRSGGRAIDLAVPAFLGGGAFLAATATTDPILTFAAFVVAAIGTYAALPAFWKLPTAMLTGAAAAGGIALINSIGNLGGYFGPSAVGWLRDTTGTHAAGLAALGAMLIFAGLLALLAARRPAADAAEERSDI